MSARPAKRLLIVGWDAADWIIIERLFAAGRLPNLRRLVEAGARAPLGTLEPKLSPLLWTSIATGRTPDRHGILNFVEPRPDGGGLRVASSTSRRVKALWNAFSQSGLRSIVVGWYASHPAEPIDGTIVTNLVQEGEPADPSADWPLAPGCVSPPEHRDAVARRRVRAATFDRERLRGLLPKVDEIGPGDARVRTLARLMASAASIEGAALEAMARTERWDAALVFFDAIDAVGHHFMQFVPPRMAHVSEREVRLLGGVMDRVYEWHDEALGRLVAAAGGDATVIVLSDHGFHSDHLRPNLSELPPERRMELESSWHRPHGVLVLSGPGVRAGAEIASPTILDLAPTALALLGLPAARDFDGRVLAEALVEPAPAPIESWETLEPTSGTAGLHPAEARQDPFEAADAIRQLVDLGYMAALPDDVQGQLDLVRRESLFNLGVALFSRRRAGEAVPHFERLVAERPGDVRYATCLGNALNASGRFEDAARVAGAALALEPGSVELRMLRALALSMAGRTSEAAADLGELERTVRRRTELAGAFAGILLSLGRHSDARRLFEVARARNPRDASAHLGLARCQLALGGFEEAAGHALDALDVTQALPEAHLALGAALAWHGDLANARASLGFALRFEPGFLEAERWLALVCERLGDRAGADAARERVEALRARAADRMADGTANGTANLVQPRREPFDAQAFAERHGLDGPRFR